MNGFVQRLKHLHLLLGLLTGWLLLFIIFSGSLSFYRAELDNIQLFKLAPLPEFTITSAASANSAAVAQAFLTKQAPVATQWYIELPQPRKPYLTVHWLQSELVGQGPGGQRKSQLYQQLLDAQTGSALTEARPIQFGATDHQPGGWFFQMHYNFMHLFGPISRSLVAYLALLWLLLSVVGLLSLHGRWRTLWQIRPSMPNAATTRTLRHNQLAVLTLPFALLFASSGWLTQMFSDNNAPQHKLYPDNPYQFYAELFPQVQPFAGARSNEPAPLPDLAASVIIAEQQLAGPVGKISLTLPGTAQSTLLLSASAAAQVSNHLPHVLFRFDASGWQQVLPDPAPGVATAAAGVSTIAQIRSIWYGLHQSLYAGAWLRFGLFLSGILCCWMIWLGLRSWLQRQTSPFWRSFILPVSEAMVLALPVCSGLLLLIQAGPTWLVDGWSLSQQWLLLFLISAQLVFYIRRQR